MNYCLFSSLFVWESPSGNLGWETSDTSSFNVIYNCARKKSSPSLERFRAPASPQPASPLETPSAGAAGKKGISQSQALLISILRGQHGKTSKGLAPGCAGSRSYATGCPGLTEPGFPRPRCFGLDHRLSRAIALDARQNAWMCWRRQALICPRHRLLLK